MFRSEIIDMLSSSAISLRSMSYVATCCGSIKVLSLGTALGKWWSPVSPSTSPLVFFGDSIFDKTEDMFDI
jgi:hypothetical protein